MSNQIIRIATRKSKLALWQAEFVKNKLLEFWPELSVQLVPMTTTGDRFLSANLFSLGGKGVFLKELEEAILDGKADIAVHSMKDVPAKFPDGLKLSAICERDNPFDALVARQEINIGSLPKGAIVGTTSLRRQSQLKALRPDLNIKPLRGNIHTRLEKLYNGNYDAIVLAAAGLIRMQLSEKISDYFSYDHMLPACGQGAIGIECRTEDLAIQKILAPLNHPDTVVCVTTERHVNALLGGHCHTPIAIFCNKIDNKQITLHAKVLSPDGRHQVAYTNTDAITNGEKLARSCAETLIEKGAKKLIDLSLT